MITLYYREGSHYNLTNFGPVMTPGDGILRRKSMPASSQNQVLDGKSTAIIKGSHQVPALGICNHHIPGVVHELLD